MKFLTCTWCGYIYPLVNKADCPYCGCKGNTQHKRNAKEMDPKDAKKVNRHHAEN